MLDFIPPDETPDERLMRVLGLSREEINSRRKTEAQLIGQILQSDDDRRAAKSQEKEQQTIFDTKTKEFLDYVFETYGV